jgi:monoamine oxidase
MYDVIIIGAGISGLIAYDELQKFEKRILLLESSNKVGGRIYTHKNNFSSPVELGAELIHTHDATTWNYVKKYNLKTYKMPILFRKKGKIYDNPFKKNDLKSIDISKLPLPFFNENALDYLNRVNLNDEKPFFFDFLNLDDEPLEKWSAMEFFELYMHYYTYGDTYGENDYRIIGGYSQITNNLAKGKEIKLMYRVTKIDYTKEKILVYTSFEDKEIIFECKKCICTVPLGVLKKKLIEFKPELPNYKIEIIEKMQTVDVVKLSYEFEQNSLTQVSESIVDMNSNPPFWWSSSGGELNINTQIITGWAGGDNARKLLELNDELRLKKGLDSLFKTLTLNQIKPINSITYNWNKDINTLGAYSHNPPLTNGFEKLLALPINNKLFFCGEAYSLDDSATVHGAIDTAFRVVKEIVDSEKNV